LTASTPRELARYPMLSRRQKTEQPRRKHPRHPLPRKRLRPFQLLLRGWLTVGVLQTSRAFCLVTAQAAVPLEISRGLLLSAAWIWPILIWSALGTREARFGTQQLLFSCARVLPRQLPAAWLAGVLLAALLGAGTALRLGVNGQATALFAWAVGALFIPSLALALGVWTGTSRFFEGLYTAIWYIGPLNHVPGLDFTGAGNGPLAGRFAWLYLGISALLLISAFARRARQLRGI
jgi:hypothetical protein